MNRKNVAVIVAFGIALIGLTSCIGIPRAKYTEQLDWTLDGAGVSAINAETANGAISVTGSTEDTVTVYAVKEVRAFTESAAEEFAREIEIHVERRGNEIQIYKEHPKPPRRINVSVSYEIHTPKAVDLHLRTSNGKIEINGIEGTMDAGTSNGSIHLQGGRGDVKLHTSNGKIELEETIGRVHARTSNGKISASVERLEGEGVFSSSNGSIDVKIYEGFAPITITTSNGSIDLTLPSDFSGRLDAKTNNGRIRSEFPVTTTATEVSKTRLFGQIGSGGETTVKLRTSNGSIHLREISSIPQT